MNNILGQRNIILQAFLFVTAVLWEKYLFWPCGVFHCSISSGHWEKSLLCPFASLVSIYNSSMGLTCFLWFATSLEDVPLLRLWPRSACSSEWIPVGPLICSIRDSGEGLVSVHITQTSISVDTITSELLMLLLLNGGSALLELLFLHMHAVTSYFFIKPVTVTITMPEHIGLHQRWFLKDCKKSSASPKMSK